MIRAMIFDLDGTLVQTERLKAQSYARAAIELCPRDITPCNSHGVTAEEVIEAFKDVVGLSRREVATALVERFGLEAKAREWMAKYGVQAPWQAFVQRRLEIYAEMLADPEVIRSNQWPHNVALLQKARETGCSTGLATMSHCEQVKRVLEILELQDAFGFVATRDDVEHGKPDPEIYLLVADELGVRPLECLVVEDSPTGVQAALNADMQVVAVSTPFTRDRLHESNLIPDKHIVDEPEELLGVVDHIIQAHMN